ncbi:N-acetylmuramoyl-L-alanine amidase/putative S-layer protein [Desulfosporosinus sp. I2]|uniref:phosphodiester glycosidase family protein n=1 Tax=Desulfosporosinus sp. I2 TaxID=1617025 RepID=UPI0005EECC39|nr:phosphodiester glycosidase family protein [Desulfosporosinus sp. I2]KJR49530.1 N-acetylmuramoyl-L-alanine amidase/putative S-layer protein [Desulfosporosinus sp. I2]
MKTRVKRIQMFLAFLGFNLTFAAILAPFIVFWGPFQALKTVAVGSVYTSRHPQVVKIFLSQAEIDRLMNVNTSQQTSAGQSITHSNVIDTGSEITIEDIQGPSYKGKVMLIKDPKRVKLAVTKKMGVSGEQASQMVKNLGAVAGINAGGFYDPDGKGNGAFPDGLTVQNGKLVHNNVGNRAVNIVGFNDQGKLIIGSMTATQLEANHILEAVTFGPNLIKDGKPEILGDGGWGIAPRTGIGQKADGTVIFVVIDGRQPTWSIGATLRDLMNVFINYQAVNAVNLDGGSSSIFVDQGIVTNRPSSVFGERYIPTAFIVTP